ncbi:MAG: HDOD domain-containing protein [Alphaproteobacteria bacterium]|nr:HDOD domain-containing protein [Alphaproteobacteria bacterium]
MDLHAEEDDLFEGIDEDLWFGLDDGESADQAAASSLAAEVARITGLKPFPAVARRIVAELSVEDWSTHRVATMMESDPSLAATLLKIANSTFYAANGRTSQDVREAVVKLGGQRVRELVMGLATLQLLNGRGRLARRCRDHCAGTAAISRVLAGVVGIPPGSLFVAGLLHDAGRMLLMESGEIEYAKLESRGKDEVPLIERETLGFDHAVLGGHVLKAWGMMEPVPKLVAWHHHPARAWSGGGEVATQLAVLRFADHICDAMENPEQDPTWRELTEGPEGEWAGLSEHRVTTLWRMLEGARAETLAIFA